MSLWRWSAGVHVLGTRLWCDAARAHGVTFVSGADVVLRRRCERIMTTERTQKLAGFDSVLPATFGRPFAMGRARLELLPAGTWQEWDRKRLEKTGGALEQYKHPCLLGDTQFRTTMPVEQEVGPEPAGRPPIACFVERSKPRNQSTR